MVPAPSFLTFASHDVRTLNSRSVAVMVTRPSRASTSRFDRIGMVVLRSTTPCVVVSSFSRADLLTLNSIAWLSSRAVPVADIHTFLREPDPLLRTLLVFRSGRKPYERDYVVGSVEIGGKLRTCNLYLVPANARRTDNPQLQLQQQRIVLSAS